MDPSIVLYPQKQLYFKVVRIIMKGLGTWPARHMKGEGQVRQDRLLYVWLIYFVCSITAMILYVARHLDLGFLKTCELLTSLFIAVFAIAHHVVPIIHKEKYGIIFKEFHDKIHLSNHLSHDEYTKKILLSKERLAAKLLYIIVGGSTIGPTLFAVVPLFVNLHSGAYSNSTAVKLESTLSLAMPFDTEHDVMGWTVLTVISLPVIFGTPLIGVSTALVFLFFVSHLDGHLDILKYNISRLPGPDTVVNSAIVRKGKRCDIQIDSYSPELEEEISRRLAGIVQHHNAILRFRSLLQSVYGELLLSIYVFNLVGYCLILLQLTRGLSDGGLRFGVIAFFLFAQMSSFSLALEDVYLKMNGLADVLYQVRWDAMRRHNKRTVLLAILISVNTKRFTAAGMLEVSAPVMLYILKTTASYFAFLRTVGN